MDENSQETNDVRLQTACMCVQVYTSHENYSYHVHKYFVNLMECRDFFPFLHKSSGGVWGGGRLTFGKIQFLLFAFSNYLN